MVLLGELTTEIDTPPGSPTCKVSTTTPPGKLSASLATAAVIFAPSWSAKVEYLYYDIRGTYGLPPIQQFGNFGATLESVNASQSSTRFAASDVRLGISYHFGN
ncbi:MAG TPA: hypothetical protein VMR17_03120 [Xanthobacteraceae bacterium]|jgi:hypothetical protein|nr:hypothetical protein [Xanthobacteraceae bacterium]